jgi:hypothetical protein
VLVLRLVEEFKIEQVEELLDVGDGIRKTAREHDVRDLVELLADVGIHEIKAEKLKTGMLK